LNREEEVGAQFVCILERQAIMAFAFTVTPTSEEDDERAECIVCLTDFMEQSDPNSHIWQCAEGHTLCSGCFSRVGGAAALCSVCDVPMGSIRNRALEKLRNAHIQRVRARTVTKPPAERVENAACAPKRDKKAARETKTESWNFKFNPFNINPLDGGCDAPNLLNAASGGEPDYAAESCTREASKKASISSIFTFVSPAAFQFGDGTAAGESGCASRAAAPAAVCAQQKDLFWEQAARASAEVDCASTASTAPSGASPTSKSSSAAHSVSPEYVWVAGTTSQSGSEHSPSTSGASGTRSASASPMEVDAFGASAKKVPAPRSKGIFAAEKAKAKAKPRVRKEYSAKESDGDDGFVFEISDMLKRTVIEPTGPANHAGHPESTQRTEAWGAEGIGADSTEQPQGPVNQAHGAQTAGYQAAANLAFATQFAIPTSAGSRFADRRADKKSCSAGGKTFGATVHDDAPKGFTFEAPAAFAHTSAPHQPAATTFAFQSSHFVFSPPKQAPGQAEQSTTQEATTQNPKTHFTFSQPATHATGAAAFTFSQPVPGGFNFTVPQPEGSGHSGAARQCPAFGATFGRSFNPLPTSSSGASSSMPPFATHCAVPLSEATSPPPARTLRRSSRNSTPGKKVGSSKASPKHRPEEDEETTYKGSQGVGGGGFHFRTPFKMPEDFAWQDEAEKTAFEKLSRMASPSAAARLLKKNPNTPPSKLLARVTMADPPAHRAKPQARDNRQHKHPQRTAHAGASSSSRPASASSSQHHISSGARQDCEPDHEDGEALSEQAITERCTTLKERGNAYFKQSKWEAAADTYAQGAALASKLVPLDYNSATADGKLVPLASLASVLYSNGANALDKLGRRHEALQCCHCALRLKADNSKAAVRGAQCATALGLFSDSLALYRAAAAQGFPDLEAEVARAERMSEDMRKAAELLVQDNGTRAKVLLSDVYAAAPTSLSVLELLVKAHLLCKEFEEAHALVKTLLRLVQALPPSGCAAFNAQVPSRVTVAVLHARALCGLGVVDGLFLPPLSSPLSVIPLLCPTMPPSSPHSWLHGGDMRGVPMCGLVLAVL